MSTLLISSRKRLVANSISIILRKDIIYSKKLLANQYYSKRLDLAHSSGGSSCLNTSLKNYLSQLALEQHTRSLTSDFAVVRQWNAHSVGYFYELDWFLHFKYIFGIILCVSDRCQAIYVFPSGRRKLGLKRS